MNANTPLCITFAGAVGSSKTPISNYLSCKLGFPVFNNDAIRSEVIEDCGFLDKDIHKERRNQRIEEILKSGLTFICDASQDREWEAFREKLEEYGYRWFIISLDLSKGKLTKLYQDKGYGESLRRLDQLVAEHDDFLGKHGHEVGISIADANFDRRLDVSYAAISSIL